MTLSLQKTIIVGLLLGSAVAQAACLDNGDGTFTCSGSSQNVTVQQGATTLDNSTAPVTLENLSTGIMRNDSLAATIGQTNTLQAVGGNAVTITNTSGLIQVDRSTASYDTSAWTSAGGLLYNNGELAGVAAAIYSDSATPSLSVTTSQNTISAAGDFSSAIHSNSAQLNVDNQYGFIKNTSYPGTPGNIPPNSLSEGHWAISSFAGASYTAPALQDGTQYATNVTAGVTTINTSGDITGDILVVDRNPLLTAAQSQNPALTLAYTANDVGPRNSVITVGTNSSIGNSIIGNIYLGSGAHVINSSGNLFGNIYVDQRDAAVTDAAGNVLYKVAGDHTFTLNMAGTFLYLGDIEINDVSGSVNNITYDGVFQLRNQITANGLGQNTVNMNCNPSLNSGNSMCAWFSKITGINTLNLGGSNDIFWESFGSGVTTNTVNGDINLTGSNTVFLSDDVTLAANRMVIGANSKLAPDFDPSASAYRFGIINADLINNGTIDLGTANLRVVQDAQFNAGSRLLTTIGAAGQGKLTVGGNGTMADGTTIVPSIDGSAFVHDGQTFLLATNTSGNPLVQNGDGFLQWKASQLSGDMMLVADVGVPAYLTSVVTTGGNNAVDALVHYTGGDAGIRRLQLDLQNLKGPDVQRAVERLRPEINDGAARMVLNHTDKVLGLMEDHLFDIYLNSLKGNTDETLASKDGGLRTGAGIWVQGFGDSGKQDTREIADSYSVSSTGMALGIDRLFGSSRYLRVGTALAYAQGNIIDDGVTVNNRTNINSYMGALYASFAPETWYLNGAIGWSKNSYSTERIAMNRRSDGQHDGRQFTVSLDTGWPFFINDTLTFVPIASLTYNRVHEDEYTEDGTRLELLQNTNNIPTFAPFVNSTNLHIEDRQFESTVSGLGGKMLVSLQQPDWHAGIELSALFNREFGDIAQNTIANFAAGGPSFYSPGVKPARDALVLGSSLRLTGDDDTDQLTMLASYDATFREEYFGQAFSLMMRYDFDQGPSYLKKTEAIKAAQVGGDIPVKPVKVTEQDIAHLQQSMAPNPAASPQAPGDTQAEKAVTATITTWMNALTNKNIDTYFNSYAADFMTADGSSRQQWERKRKLELKRDENPVVKMAYLTVKPEGNHALAVFTQTTLVQGRQEVVQKIIDLKNSNGNWLIVKEDSVAISD